MGKVYDALQRAEQQRSRSVAEAGAPRVSLDRMASPPPTERKRVPFFNRWLGRRAARRPADVGAGDINKRRIALLQPESFVVEQFRTLRARIDSLAAERPIRTIAITSALPGEGKTTAAINLAIVTSMNVERRVLLIDCDLRGTKLHRSLGLQPEMGLAEVLTGQGTLEKAVQIVEGTELEVLPVLQLPPNPSELLASMAMRSLLKDAAARYDLIILDTPPTLSLPDAKTVSELCDGFVFVVRAGVTRQHDVQAALEILDRRRLLGLVLNGADVDTGRVQYSR